MKYNLKSIMHNAWKFVRKLKISISEALRMAWKNAKTTAAAKTAAGITETVHTWAGWQALGYEVRHGSAAALKVRTIDPATKSGTRTAVYFTAAQVQPIEA